MKEAWKGNTTYDLPKLCCKKLDNCNNIQLQNKTWWMFGSSDRNEQYKIRFCPFCATPLTSITPTKQVGSKA